jgi:choline dehydrogenase-like flavoprotein
VKSIFDAIVVGSGAAGGFAAKTLTEGGLQTLVLEAGPRRDPARDFPGPGAGDRLARVRAALWRQPIQARSTSFKGYLRHFYVDDRENPYTAPSGKPFYWIRGRQVGGRMLMWACLSPRLSDLELRSASHDGCGDDWPLTYADLAPYYDTVETSLGLCGQADGLPQLPDGRYAASRELTPGELEFKQVVENRWPERHVLQARVIRPEAANGSLPLADAERTGNLSLRPNAVVRRITTDRQTGLGTGVEYVDRVERKVRHARGRLVFLCASAFESVRILLNSACERHPEGLGGGSGVLGRYVTDHLFLVRSGPLPRSDLEAVTTATDPYDFGAVHGFYVPRFRNLDERESEFVRGYGLCGGIGRTGPHWWMAAFGEMLAHRDNRITLDRRKKDAWDVPVVHIDCAHGDNDRALIADARRRVDEMTEAAGLRRGPWWGEHRLREIVAHRSFVDSGIFHPGFATHELGGARMGSDASSSVLDPSCRCWDAENVLVTDGACFVSSAYQNPTLSIMALTVRAADLAIADFKTIAA